MPPSPGPSWPLLGDEDHTKPVPHDPPQEVPQPGHPALAQVLPVGTLLAACLALHLAAMWPAYPQLTNAPIVTSPSETAIYIVLELGWALAAALVLSRVSVRGGVALGAGVGAVELGFLVSDLAGSLLQTNRDTPGVWLAVGGLGFGLAGVLLGASVVQLGSPRVHISPERQPRSVLTVLVALLATATFVPSWDRFTAFATRTGASVSWTQGNVFHNPAGIMAGDLVAALAIVALPAIAAFWAPLEVGAWAIAGVFVALGSEVLSAAVQVRGGVTSALLQELTRDIGLTPAQADALGVHFSISLTGWWTADAAATVALGALALWAAVDARRPEPEGATSAEAAGALMAERHWPPPHLWPND